ncbi:NBS-LRR type disease resistance protein, partial [Melia azedarach]
LSSSLISPFLFCRKTMGNIFSVQIPCDALFCRCLDCIFRQTTYLCNLKENLVNLQTKLEDLIQTRNDVLRRVRIAEQQHMTRLNRVELWITRVQALENEVDELQRVESQEVDKLCLGGFCSKSCKSSYSYGKKVAKKLKEVANLIGEGEFQVVAERQPEAAVDERPIEQTVGTESTFDKVWSCLGQEHVGIIGLYGMGGVGKTTLLTQINNKFVDTPNDFDVVIWVVVSKDLKLEKIQEDIGKRIGLTDSSWKTKNLEDKAADIFRILSKTKFVLLLDDLWKRVDLTRVGVPLPSPKIASTVIFTTRLAEVCGAMKAQKNFKVECLAHEKAWILFQENVGRNILENHPDIPELAEIMARECDGLPLALITIGRAMASKKTPEEWKYAIQVLRRSASEFPGMDEVYPILKFSYDNLAGEKIKSCFLYCSLFPEDYKINKIDLIDCLIGEGILDDNDRTGARNEGYYIIGILLCACLLEEIDDETVKMHDVIRDMALWIASEIEKEKENFLVRAGAGLTEVPEIERWTGVRRISLMQNKIEDLSFTPICPDLQTLLLQDNIRLTKIGSSFFQFMSSLKVLNLSNNFNLTELPSGISKLVSLQHLDLSKTQIEALPKELEALVNLKYLNLEYTGYLYTIPAQLISKLSMLQVLRMFCCGFPSENYEFLCELGDDYPLGHKQVLIDDLQHLKHLNELTMTLKCPHALRRFLSSYMENLHTLYIDRCLYLQEFKIGRAEQAQQLHETHAFHGLHTVKIQFCCRPRDLTWLILAPNLKKLDVHFCENMEEIISPQKLRETPETMRNLIPFAKLQYLILKDLQKLRSIYWNPLPFPHLKEIAVHWCPLLRKLPLDSNSAKERKVVIRGKDDSWWENLIWEDQAAKNAFSHCIATAYI